MSSSRKAVLDTEISELQVAAPQPRKSPMTIDVPAIDLRLLAEQCLGDLSFGITMLELFEQTAAERLEELRRLSQQGSFEQLIELSLTLRGSTGILGAEYLMDLLGQMRDAAENQQKSDIQGLMTQIEAEFRRVLAEISRLRSLKY